ncbi:hypothetical protein PTKIN_Ptkin09bG0218100 [Pterospermum kingtungense]
MALRSETEKRKEDPVSISIDQMLTKLSSKSAKPCICRVPNYLRAVNEKAYEPQAISIGPYHRGKNHLEAMEELKVRLLQKLLEERKENDVDAYVMKIRELENEARKCYAEPVNDINSDDFVKVLLVDGVFIVQIIRRFLRKRPYYLINIVDKCSDCVFQYADADILLLENQLPFFVLWELFHMIENSADQDVFMGAVFGMLCNIIPGKVRPREDLKSLRLEEIKHLLDFTRHCCCHPSNSEVDSRTNQPGGCTFMLCATELKEAGIKFKLVQGNSMFDIRFENQTLYIPKINIEDHTERFLRNLIAFEQLFLADRDFMLTTDYTAVLDNLINSPKDVEILCQNKIIENYLGDDAAVATMINGLGVSIMNSQNFYYSEVCNQINKHCDRRCNRWMANLKHKYFNTPWALLSVLAAALLLLLTVLQTVFSILSYAK